MKYNNRNISLSIGLPRDLYDRLDHYHWKDQKSKSMIVQEAVRMYITQRDSQKKGTPQVFDTNVES